MVSYTLNTSPGHWGCQQQQGMQEMVVIGPPEYLAEIRISWLEAMGAIGT
jgi:hypothetical protein